MQAEEPLDVVFADPGPLDGFGFEWVRQMRMGTWDRPVSVVFCFAADRATMDRALAIGAGHFAFKPYFQPAIAAKPPQLAQGRAHLAFTAVEARG